MELCTRPAVMTSQTKKSFVRYIAAWRARNDNRIWRYAQLRFCVHCTLMACARRWRRILRQVVIRNSYGEEPYSFRSVEIWFQNCFLGKFSINRLQIVFTLHREFTEILAWFRAHRLGSYKGLKIWTLFGQGCMVTIFIWEFEFAFLLNLCGVFTLVSV